jgi:hypothetical protein
VPHVVLSGRPGPEALHAYAEGFQPFVFRDGGLVVKVERLYREHAGRGALLETVVSERGHTQKFFIQLSPKGAELTIRLEPLTDPEKTPAVRRALALVAARVVAATGCVYARGNIDDALIR